MLKSGVLSMKKPKQMNECTLLDEILSKRIKVRKGHSVPLCTYIGYTVEESEEWMVHC